MKLSDNANLIFKSRYAINEDETWQELSERVAQGGAQVEPDFRYWRDVFAHDIYNMLFLPGGRILRNVGRPRGSLFNCYCINVDDTIESIAYSCAKALILWSEGGGVGFNFNSLRPENAPIIQKGGESTGPLSFMSFFNGGAQTIKTGGSRRAAALGLMLCNHPNIIEFIKAKEIDGKFNNFNLSVGVTEKFLECVELNSDWDLSFNQKTWKTVKSRDLWDLIIKGMVDNAEPGLINWDNLRSNNSWYFSPIVGVNPCQPKWATVLTKNGISTIGNINIGDEIWSQDGWVKVINKINSGVKNVYRYRTNASVFYGTKNHKVVNKGKKIEIDNSDAIDVLIGNYEYKNDFNYKIVMDGVVLGDGSVHKASNNLVHLYIGEDDKDYFKSEIKHLILNHRPGLKDAAYEIETSITYEELPMTYNRCIPHRFKFGNNKVVRSFLRGLYTANGSVLEKYNRITLKSSSKKIIEDVQIMLSSIGISSYYTKNKSKNVIFENGEYKCKESYDLNISKDTIKFQKLIGFIQEYKNEKLNIINRRKFSNYRKITFGINEKKYISTEEVFDITVNGKSHTYWSGGCNVSNCGEAVLSNMEVCDLGSLILPNFITGTKNTNWQLMEKTVHNAVRFLDNIIQVNRYVIDEIRTNAFNSRRIGIGVMGLAEYLFAKKIRYGSEEAVQETERLMRNIRNFIYDASIKIAEEKEPFPKFDSVLYSKSHFVRTLPAKLRKSIKKYGVRNVTGMALAPTGTISMLPEVTSCIEPLPFKSYLRHDEIGDRAYIHPIYKKIIENNEEEPSWYVDTSDLKPQDHFEMQAACQRYTDGAVSKTINCPKGFKAEQLNELLLEYIRDLKGTTLYVDGSREGQILNPLTRKEAEKYIKEDKITQDQEEMKCSSGSCDI